MSCSLVELKRKGVVECVGAGRFYHFLPPAAFSSNMHVVAGRARGEDRERGPVGKLRPHEGAAGGDAGQRQRGANANMHHVPTFTYS